MTQPDRLTPESAANRGSFAAFAAKTQEQWQEEQRGKTAASLNNAKAGFSNIGRDTSKILGNITEAFFGWVGSLPSHADSKQALADQAAATAALAASVTALQNNQNNQSVGGRSESIDFSLRADATSLGTDFTQTYSLSGSGVWGISGGRAAWLSVNDSDRACVAVYNVEDTATDYQVVGASFATSPVWFNSASQGRNRLLGRMNSSGTSYVYADFGKYDVELGCVVSGVKTVFASESDFSFKANSLYWLRCGSVGGARVFQVVEGTAPVITHTEVGTTSQLGASYRYTGAGVYADATPLGTSPPGKMSAWAFADNQPPTVYGSGARMIRTSTGGVNVSSGTNVLPNNFFGSLAERTEDVGYDLTAGSFTAGVDGWYDIDIRLAIDHFVSSSTSNGADYPPFPLHLLLYKNGSVEKWVGGSVLPYPRGAGSSGSGTQYYGSPDAAVAQTQVYLQAGDDIQVGYNADASKTGFFTGDAAGLKCYFAITLANRSLA